MLASCPHAYAFSLRILWAAVPLHELLPGAAQVLQALLWQLVDSDSVPLSLELQKVQYRSVTSSYGVGGRASRGLNLNFLQIISWVGKFV